MSMFNIVTDKIANYNTSVTSVIILAGGVVTAALMASMLVRSKSSETKHCPHYLPSSNDKSKSAGMIETIISLAGPEWPHKMHSMMKNLPSKQRWIGRLNLPLPKPCKMGFLVADAKIARDILRDKGSIKPEGIYADYDRVTGDMKSIFTENGIRWKHPRKCISRAFSSNHVKRMDRICAQKLDIWIKETLEPLVEKEESFDVPTEMVQLTLSILCEAAFEYDISEKERDAFIHNLEIAFKEFIFADPIRKTFPFLFPQVRRAKQAANTLIEIAMNILKAYREKNARRKAQSDATYEDDTIIFRIVNNPDYKNDKERAADIVVLLAAGHDTTAFTLAWTLLEIARSRPPELNTYRKNITNLERKDWNRVDELHYIIQEGLRVHPVAAVGGVRQTAVDFVYDDESFQRKLTIPKNSVVFISSYAMFHNPEYYHEPDKFLPSRWADSSKQMELALMPFSLGHRNCVGQTLANAEIKTVLATLCANYDFTVEDEGHGEFFLTYKPVGVKLIARRVSEADK